MGGADPEISQVHGSWSDRAACFACQELRAVARETHPSEASSGLDSKVNSPGCRSMKRSAAGRWMLEQPFSCHVGFAPIMPTKNPAPFCEVVNRWLQTPFGRPVQSAPCIPPSARDPCWRSLLRQLRRGPARRRGAAAVRRPRPRRGTVRRKPVPLPPCHAGSRLRNPRLRDSCRFGQGLRGSSRSVVRAQGVG